LKDDIARDKIFSFNLILLYYIIPIMTVSEIKESIESAGEKMKRGTKKAGHNVEEGAEETKDKVD
jgi:hypothetical protein